MTLQVPDFTSDAEAEAFLDQGLSDLDFGEFKPLGFDFDEKAPLVADDGQAGAE